MLTNLSREQAAVSQHAAIYRARGAVEIQFRAWKQALNLSKALNPTQPGRPILIADTGTSGLPLIPATGEPGTRTFSIQYLRRQASANSGLTYTAQVCSSLDAEWSTATGTETALSIDAEWERVTIEENATGQPKRFGLVKVTGAL